jgi:hypothetical protein
MKKGWKKSMVTIFKRGLGAERVLQGCKNPATGTGGGPHLYDACVEIVTNPGGEHIAYCSGVDMS